MCLENKLHMFSAFWLFPLRCSLPRRRAVKKTNLMIDLVLPGKAPDKHKVNPIFILIKRQFFTFFGIDFLLFTSRDTLSVSAFKRTKVSGRSSCHESISSPINVFIQQISIFLYHFSSGSNVQIGTSCPHVLWGGGGGGPCLTGQENLLNWASSVKSQHLKHLLEQE